MHRSAGTPVGPALAAAVPLAAFLFLRLHPGHDPTLGSPAGHFYVVSPAALLAAAFALAVGGVGIRLRNHQVLFLALANLSLAVIFALHGLATPGLLLDAGTRVAPVAAQLSFLLTAAWLWLSTLPGDSAFVRAVCRKPAAVMTGWTLLLALVVVVFMRFPALADWVPVDRVPLEGPVALVACALLAAAGHRYWRAYRQSGFPLQGAIVYACSWLVAAQVIAAMGTVWRASWWIYHALLVLATLALHAGLLRQYAGGRSLDAAVRMLFEHDPTGAVLEGIAPSVRALVVATEARDPYTAGHGVRVALAALALGRELGLPLAQLRALAQGTLVHDVGKIQVPDHILNKPGPLTAEERRLVERHPLTGFDMCRRLGFMAEELQVIRSHHERWDGGGYPDGLRGEEIPLLARIVAICDVYDALTSNRAYRRALTHQAAREYIVSQAGTQFDPRLVEVWARLTANGPLIADPPLWVELVAAAASA